ncbi:MAG: acyl-CoA dehydrogenase, partial [Alphaproteobacteria bacterium]
IEETGAAQHLRDARIAPIYEGTNGIQAIDLVTRKLPLDDGAVVRAHISGLGSVVADVKASNLPELGRMGQRLEEAVAALEEATGWMLTALAADPQGALAGATPYLRLFGTASSGVWLARGALAHLRTSGADDARGEAFLQIARFYAETLATEAPGLALAITQGAGSLAAVADDALAGPA